MSFFSALFGRSRDSDHKAAQLKAEVLQRETEEQVEQEKGRLHQAVQSVQSGSRVMENMAGMIRLMSIMEHESDRHR